MSEKYKFELNSKTLELEADGQRPLLDVLREDLYLTGTKFGCGEGECGACTVLVDNEATRSCITTLAEVEGRSITTIEGLANGDHLHPVQTAFLDEQAMQCGYCVPGQIMTACAFLETNANPTPAEIREAMSGNLCRCCNYESILAAVENAAAKS